MLDLACNRKFILVFANLSSIATLDRVTPGVGFDEEKPIWIAKIDPQLYPET
jgi:hypothetical protein